MSVDATSTIMSDEGRALLTEREREIIAGNADVSDNYQYKVESTVRNRIKKRLGDDVDFLETNFPKAYKLVIEEVCAEIEAKND